MDGKLALFDVNPGGGIKTWQAHDNTIQEIAISNDGNMIATASE